MSGSNVIVAYGIDNIYNEKDFWITEFEVYEIRKDVSRLAISFNHNALQYDVSIYMEEI